MSWGDLTDAQWRIFDPLLPDRGERGPGIEDKRRTVNGILWVLRTGAPWRDTADGRALKKMLAIAVLLQPDAPKTIFRQNGHSKSSVADSCIR